MTSNTHYHLIKQLNDIEIIKNDGSINSNINKLLTSHPTLLSELLNATKFLNSTYDDLPLSMRVKILIKNITSIPICENEGCKKPIIISKKRISRHCSSKCARNNPRVRKKYDNTCINKYGTKYPTQSKTVKQKTIITCQRKYNANSPLESTIVLAKINETNLQKYGTSSVLSNNEIRNKLKATNLIKFGFENALSNTNIHDKTKASLLKNHGVDYPLQSKTIMDKKSTTCKDKYNTDHWSESQINMEARKKLNNLEWLYDQHITQEKPFTVIGSEIGVYYGTVANYLHRAGFETNYTNSSYMEREIVEFLKSNNVIVETNTRQIIKPFEIDIYLPEYDVAIEFNGNYWHSELAGRDRNYHINKTNLCKDKGIQLIHVLESEWVLKCDIIKSRLMNIIQKNERIFARKCEIVEIIPEDKKMFLDTNHLQGNVGSSINYGLRYDGYLVAIMTFGKPRFSKKCEYEMLRFSTKMGSNVIGGASRLFNHFLKNNKPVSVVSYGDLRYGTGGMYANLGFMYSHTSLPNCQYFHKSDTFRLYSRLKFQKHKLEKQLSVFDPKLTAWENMQNNGYNRIWDCGNSVWVWRDE